MANLLNGVGNVICGYLKSLKILNTITIHGFLSCPNWLPGPPWLMNSYLSLILKSSQSLNIKKEFFNFFHLFSTWLVPLQSENFRLEFIYFLCIEDEGKKKHICYVLHHDALDVRVAMNVKNEFLKLNASTIQKLHKFIYFHIMGRTILAVCTLKWLIFWKINSSQKSILQFYLFWYHRFNGNKVHVNRIPHIFFKYIHLWKENLKIEKRTKMVGVMKIWLNFDHSKVLD
jgi:hypothetical protein